MLRSTQTRTSSWFPNWQPRSKRGRYGRTDHVGSSLRKGGFQYAQAHQQLADWSAALGVLAAVSQDDTVRQLLKEPQLTSSAKAQSLIDVCGDKLNAPAQNFVRTVAENKRLELLPTIAEMYEQLKAEQEKSVEVEVTSAFTLSKNSRTNSPRLSAPGSVAKCGYMRRKTRA